MKVLQKQRPRKANISEKTHFELSYRVGTTKCEKETGTIRNIVSSFTCKYFLSASVSCDWDRRLHISLENRLLYLGDHQCNISASTLCQLSCGPCDTIP